MRMSLEEIFLSLTTEETAGATAPSRPRMLAVRPKDTPMGNVIAIAQKELKSHFRPLMPHHDRVLRAPGYFYIAILAYFVRQSMQMNQFRAAGPDINQVLIRQLLQNVTILILFIMPMITMLMYSKRNDRG